MTEIIGAMDVSGNQKIGNYKYIAIVIGTKECINSMIKNFGELKIHTSSMKSKKSKEKFWTQLNLKNKDIMALCLRIDRDPIVEKFQMRLSKKSKSVLLRTHNYLVWRQIKHVVESFSITHGSALSEISFECDGDCISFAKVNGLHVVDEGNAHMLADIIAWFNNHNREPEGVISKDLRIDLEKSMKMMARNH